MTKNSKQSSKKSKTIALIMAAGRGVRLSAECPKQYLSLGGKPVIRYAIEKFLQHPGIDGVRVVIHRDDKDLYAHATSGLKLLEPAIGCDKRQESVHLGLKSLKRLKPDSILIHDAARPLLSGKLIDNVLKKLEKEEAVIPVIRLADTVKEIRDDRATKTLDRSRLVLAQTPQGFAFATILKAHAKLKGKDFSDDAGILEHMGVPIRTIEGEENNFKITTGDDFKRAKDIIKGGMETRVGKGFDVHRFGAKPKNGKIKLCGVNVKYDKSLEGHSDADVGLHALVDGILGTIAREDIGHHFSPREKRWKNADSAQFVIHAGKLLENAGGIINHIDITFIGERPKIGPYRKAMKQRVAELLGIAEERVSIKATTTEGLGFLGKEEGFAAEAVVTIRLPVTKE